MGFSPENPSLSEKKWVFLIMVTSACHTGYYNQCPTEESVRLTTQAVFFRSFDMWQAVLGATKDAFGKKLP